LVDLELVSPLWHSIGERHPGISVEKRQRALVRDMIGTMVGDVLAETARRVNGSGVESLEDVRLAGRPLVGFSEGLAEQEGRLKRFLYEKLYDSAELRVVRTEAQRIVANLADAYRNEPGLLPEAWRTEGEPRLQLRTLGDFIAGMTDRFAIARHEELIGPVDLRI
jgi:dGTPase